MKKWVLALQSYADELGKLHKILIRNWNVGRFLFDEMVEVAEALGVRYEQVFVLPDGEKIGMT